MPVWRPSSSSSSSRFLAVGAPLLVLVGAGFVGLQHLLSGKLEIKDAHKRALELGDKARKEFDLEAEAERLAKTVLEENYENKPIARPRY